MRSSPLIRLGLILIPGSPLNDSPSPFWVRAPGGAALRSSSPHSAIPGSDPLRPKRKYPDLNSAAFRAWSHTHEHATSGGNGFAFWRFGTSACTRLHPPIQM